MNLPVHLDVKIHNAIIIQQDMTITFKLKKLKSYKFANISSQNLKKSKSSNFSYSIYVLNDVIQGGEYFLADLSLYKPISRVLRILRRILRRISTMRPSGW